MYFCLTVFAENLKRKRRICLTVKPENLKGKGGIVEP